MNMKRFWLAAAAVYVWFFVAGFLVHEVLLADTYTALADAFRSKEEMNARMLWMILSGVLLTLLFCYIFTKGYQGLGLMEGARYGLLMGLFLGIPNSFDSYVVYPITGELAGWWFGTIVLNLVIGGTILAAIYRRPA